MSHSSTRADSIPALIQGGMGVGVSSWQLASAVARGGGLGVVSGVGPDLLLARVLQDGDPGGHVRRVLAGYPDQELVALTLSRFFRAEGLADGEAYRPLPRLDLHQRPEAMRFAALGGFVQVALAKSGHDGKVGINLLEKVQIWTPPVLLGAMVAGVDVVLVGAGVPSNLPRLIDGISAGDTVRLPIDVEGSQEGDTFEVVLDPAAVLRTEQVRLPRPAFLAIVSSHVLASYLQRDEVTAADGFVVEGWKAGGHNAPPRRAAVDDTGQTVYTERDEADLAKMAALGRPFWLAGGYGTPAKFVEALAAGAHGVQVGTPFALCRESGMRPDLRETVVADLRAGTVVVRTDPLASPTGFPFKVLQVEGTLSDRQVHASRERICDLGYLRTLVRRDDGTVAYRCPSEPVDAYVRKGGEAADTEGRVCLCNGLLATAGYPQRRKDGTEELPVLTLGADLEAVTSLAAEYPDGWGAADVVTWITRA
jgi:NAD(P)H-dependent flavin oxidoreductase YrpB (nitropropane dioxygenase family)